MSRFKCPSPITLPNASSSSSSSSSKCANCSALTNVSCEALMIEPSWLWLDGSDGERASEEDAFGCSSEA
eukprot:2074847-Rhodomonas_salina.1